jgi:hypothetical protein
MKFQHGGNNKSTRRNQNRATSCPLSNLLSKTAGNLTKATVDLLPATGDFRLMTGILIVAGNKLLQLLLRGWTGFLTTCVKIIQPVKFPVEFRLYHAADNLRFGAGEAIFCRAQCRVREVKICEASDVLRGQRRTACLSVYQLNMHVNGAKCAVH